MSSNPPFDMMITRSPGLASLLTVRTMSEHVDVDVSGVIRREITIPEAGDRVIEMIRRAPDRHSDQLAAHNPQI